jgi:c(7)-type cytochrome triheme protein
LGLVTTVVAALVAACTTANPVMTFFFDGVPAPGEEHVAQAVVKQPRRPTYKKPPPKVTFVEVPELPPAIDWKGRFDALPRNDNGDVVWSKALEEKLITPKAGIDADAKDEDPTDMDTELATSGQAEYKVIFPHKAHTQWMQCPACHTGIFEMEKGKTKMTMAAMGEGKQCGACHGKVATPDITACPSCHKELGK